MFPSKYHINYLTFFSIFAILNTLFIVDKNSVLSQDINNNLRNINSIIANNKINYDKSLELIDQAIALTKTIAEPSVKNQNLTNIIQAIVQLGELEKALEIIPLIVYFQDLETFKQSISYTDLSMIEYDFIKTRNDRINALNIIAQGYIEQGNYDKALTLLQDILAFKAQTKDYLNFYDNSEQATLKTLAIKLTQNAELEKALKITNLITVNLTKAQVLNEIATEIISLGNITKAEAILEQSLTTIQLVDNYEYAYQANGSCQNEKFEVLSEIGKNLTKLGQISTARKIALEVKGCAGAAASFFQFYQRDAFINLIQQVNDLDVLKQIWQESQQISFDAEKLPVWQELAIKFIDLNQIDYAFQIAKHINNNIQPITSISSDYDLFNIDAKETSLIAIAVNFTEVGREDLALNLVTNLHNIFKPEMQDLGIISLAKSLKNQGKLEKASSLLEQYLSFPNNYDVGNKIKEYPDLFSLVDSFKRVSLALVEIDETAIILNKLPEDKTQKTLIIDALIYALTQKNQLEQAFSIAKTYQQQTPLVKDIALKYIENKPDNLELPLRISEYLNDVSLQQEIKLAMVNYLINDVKNENDVEELIKKYHINNLTYPELMPLVAFYWAKFGNLERSLTTINNSDSLSIKIETITKIIPFINQENDLKLITSLLIEQKNKLENDNYLIQANYDQALELVANQWLKIGNLDQSLAIIALIKESYKKVTMMETLIPQLNNINYLSKLLQFYQKNNLEVDEFSHYSLLNQIALQMLKVGAIDEAIKTQELITEPKAKVEHLCFLAINLRVIDN